MAKKLALTLIAAGAIGALTWEWNLKNAMQISENIRNNPEYSQLTEDKIQLEAGKNPKFRMNEAYGGGSGAMMLAEGAAFIGGFYLLLKKDDSNSE